MVLHSNLKEGAKFLWENIVQVWSLRRKFEKMSNEGLVREFWKRAQYYVWIVRCIVASGGVKEKSIGITNLIGFVKVAFDWTIRNRVFVDRYWLDMNYTAYLLQAKICPTNRTRIQSSIRDRNQPHTLRS